MNNVVTFSTKEYEELLGRLYRICGSPKATPLFALKARDPRPLP